MSVCYWDRTMGRKLLHYTKENYCLSATITCTSQKAVWKVVVGGRDETKIELLFKERCVVFRKWEI